MKKIIKTKTEKAVCPIHGEFMQLQIGALKQPCPECKKAEKEKEVANFAEFRAAQIESGIKKRYLQAYLGDLLPVAGREYLAKTVQDYCRKFRHNLDSGRCLTITGGVGIGKTYIAAALVNALLKSKFSVQYTTLFDMLSDIISSYKNEKIAQERTLSKYTAKQLLIVDEVETTELTTEIKNNVLFQVVNARYNNLLPIIIISNNPYILNQLDKRISDRLKENGGIFIHCKSESIRK